MKIPRCCSIKLKNVEITNLYKGGKAFANTKRHLLEGIDAKATNKCGLLLIFGSNKNFSIARISINKTIEITLGQSL